MKTLITDKSKIGDILLDVPLPSNKPWQHCNRTLFGEENTIGFHLRRRGKAYEDDIKNYNGDLFQDFGKYLGKVGEKWMVGIKWPFPMAIYIIEAYDTLNELKEEWELD